MNEQEQFELPEEVGGEEDNPIKVTTGAKFIALAVVLVFSFISYDHLFPETFLKRVLDKNNIFFSPWHYYGFLGFAPVAWFFLGKITSIFSIRVFIVLGARIWETAVEKGDILINIGEEVANDKGVMFWIAIFWPITTSLLIGSSVILFIFGILFRIMIYFHP